MHTLKEALEKRRAMYSGEVWASEILKGRLWLGAGRDAEHKECLCAHGITHILNCTDDVPNFHEDDPSLTYCKLWVGDFGNDIGIRRVFPQAHDFVKSAFQETTNKVLVHCANGSNRSATIVISLMMNINGTCSCFKLCVCCTSVFSILI